MNSTYKYAYEKFVAALESLATRTGDVRERLAGAYFHFHTVRDKHLPGYLQHDYQWVLKQLMRYDPVVGPDGIVIRNSLDETLRRIRKSTGTKIAKRIFEIYWHLNRLNIARRLG